MSLGNDIFTADVISVVISDVVLSFRSNLVSSGC